MTVNKKVFFNIAQFSFGHKDILYLLLSLLSTEKLGHRGLANQKEAVVSLANQERKPKPMLVSSAFPALCGNTVLVELTCTVWAFGFNSCNHPILNHSCSLFVFIVTLII